MSHKDAKLSEKEAAHFETKQQISQLQVIIDQKDYIIQDLSEKVAHFDRRIS
jgi:uncharacterized protein (DUF3084 family)